MVRWHKLLLIFPVLGLSNVCMSDEASLEYCFNKYMSHKRWEKNNTVYYEPAELGLGTAKYFKDDPESYSGYQQEKFLSLVDEYYVRGNRVQTYKYSFNDGLEMILMLVGEQEYFLQVTRKGEDFINRLFAYCVD